MYGTRGLSNSAVVHVGIYDPVSVDTIVLQESGVDARQTILKLIIRSSYVHLHVQLSHHRSMWPIGTFKNKALCRCHYAFRKNLNTLSDLQLVSTRNEVKQFSRSTMKTKLCKL